MSARNRIGAVALLSLLGAAPAPSDAPASSVATGPVLVIHARRSGERDLEVESREGLAMSLAIASLSRSDRADIVAHLAYAAARLEARLIPVESDLGDDVEPLEELQSSMQRFTPALTAARALEQGVWATADLTVRVGETCESAALQQGDACVRLWNDTGRAAASGRESEASARARFLAWPAAHAAVVDLGDPASARRFAERLRDGATAERSAVGIVLLDEDLGTHDVAERARLEEAARRLGAAVAASGIEAPSQLDALGRPRPSGRAAPWLTLSRTAVLVVPRLSSLAHLERLGAEIEAAAGGMPFRWDHRP